MDEPGFTGNFLRASQVAIWGLGLMGGSLALALRGKCAGLIGIDSDPTALSLAEERHIVDHTFSVQPGMDLSREIFAGVDLIVLAVPVRAILQVVAMLPDLVSGSPVVIDLGSTKARIVEMMAGLPERFDPIGGHPMCGKEKSSLVNAEAAIFRNAPFALVPLERTSSRARVLAEELVRAVSACPPWLAADQHDRWVAATSHTPFLVASALAHATPAEAAPLVGPGFRGAARLAGSSSRMMVDILATNADNIRAAIHEFKAQLDRYEELLEQEDFESLEDQFNDSAAQYQRLIGG